MAANQNDLFRERLTIYWSEVNQCSQFLYAYLAIHARASADDDVRRALNENAIFWNTALAGLQTSFFIVLGRIYDRNSQHGPKALLQLITERRHLFGKDGLRERKRHVFKEDVDGLERYVADVIAPEDSRVRRLERLVTGYTAIYDRVYRELRSRVFAHKVHVATEKVQALFSRTNVDELQRLVTFLTRLYEAVWQSFENGHRLTLKRQRHSIDEILANPKGSNTIKPVGEETVADVKKVLDLLARNVQRPAEAP